MIIEMAYVYRLGVDLNLGRLGYGKVTVIYRGVESR